MKSILAYALLVILIPLAAVAEEGFQSYLVPLALRDPLPGAHGSLWTTTFTVANSSSTTVGVGPFHVPNQLPEASSFVGPGAMFSPTLVQVLFFPPPSRGALVLVPSDRKGDIHFRLRIHDISRQALTWGTEIPVVGEDEAFTSAVQLLDVPTDSRFRQMLRIYGFDPARPGLVEVRFFAEDATLIATKQVALTNVHQDPRFPTYGEIAWLTGELPEIAAEDRVRIEIVPLTPGLRLWAFVSVTNNETQHVTVVTPGR